MSAVDEAAAPAARWWRRHPVASIALTVTMVVALVVVLVYVAAWHAAEGFNNIN